jgi:hypothetical protein
VTDIVGVVRNFSEERPNPKKDELIWHFDVEFGGEPPRKNVRMRHSHFIGTLWDNDKVRVTDTEEIPIEADAVYALDCDDAAVGEWRGEGYGSQDSFEGQVIKIRKREEWYWSGWWSEYRPQNVLDLQLQNGTRTRLIEFRSKKWPTGEISKNDRVLASGFVDEDKVMLAERLDDRTNGVTFQRG